MSIKDRVKTDMVAAMKAQDKDRLATVRLIQAALRKKEIDTRVDIDDAGMVSLLQNMAKQRRDSIEQFKKGNRDDLVQKELKELAIVESYLPQQLCAADLEKLVADTIKEMGASSMKDMGNVMKAVSDKAAGQADGSTISQVVRSKLS